MNGVWIVWGTHGEWSNTSVWVVSTHTGEEAARAEADALNEWTRTARKKTWHECPDPIARARKEDWSARDIEYAVAQVPGGLW